MVLAAPINSGACPQCQTGGRPSLAQRRRAASMHGACRRLQGRRQQQQQRCRRCLPAASSDGLRAAVQPVLGPPAAHNSAVAGKPPVDGWACLREVRWRASRSHLREYLLMAVTALTFTHVLDAQAASLTDAATTAIPEQFQYLSEFQQGVVSGFLLIFFSELGDKTFFIALLLSLKQAKPVVFAGTFGALAVMTVISVALGELIHKADTFLPFGGLPLDDILATALLIFFGIRTLQEAGSAEEDALEERGEAQEAVTQLEAGQIGALFASTFALVFAAEWGDKSFLATIALAASSSPVGVTLGAVGGHGVATGIAVLGGGLLSKNVSERAVQYLGGSLFLVFAAGSVYDIVTRGSAG